MSAALESHALTAYGHSWAHGTGASERHRGFAALAARALCLRHDDRAQSGSLSTATARLLMASPPPAAVLNVVMTGLNDARLKGAAAAELDRYAAALGAIFEALRRANPRATVLALEQPYLSDYAGYPPFHRASNTVIDGYNVTLREVASHHSARVVASTDWNVDTMLCTDGVHAGDAGHRHLAQAVVRAARQSLRFTDQKAAPTSAASAERSADRISR